MADGMASLDLPRDYLSGPMKEVIVGAAGGVTQVLIGQPFDIVKVRMQTQANEGAMRVAQHILKREGPLAFYKGTLSPLVGVGACISIVYTSFHGFSTLLHSLNPTSPSLSLPQTYLAGGMAGLTNSLISGPMEHIRIRLQTQSTTSVPAAYTGVRGCIRHIVQQGGPSGLYRGQTATMLREFHSYGIWFSVFEVLLSLAMKVEEKPRDQIAGWKIAACGALTGEVLWTANYPFDVVKSKMQADGFGADRRYRDMRDVVRQTWAEAGARGFFNGLGPTLLRAVPVSAGTFVV
ncbi:mitochondrial carrier protein [Aspergillus ambiguus]|uniref:mitochondrial carrier protein n=1 Tax=Aspergillus ambiguus TaxID=176160 RepID=UPI003CCCA229